MNTCVLVILGAGATGKSTLSRRLLSDGAPVEVSERATLGSGDVERVRYTLGGPLGRDPDTALVGNLKNGSDSISSMEAKCCVINWMLVRPGVSLVICDGVRSSKQWDVDWLRGHPARPRLCYAYVELSMEENLRRLRARRAANGKSVELEQKTLDNVESFRRRARTVWEYARRSTDVGLVRLGDEHGTDAMVAAVRQAVAAAPIRSQQEGADASA